MVSNLPGKIGAFILDKAKAVLYGTGYFLQVIRESIRFFRKNQVGYRVLVMQVLFTGVEAFAIIAIIGFALGFVIITQGYSILSQFNQTKLMYTFLVLIITRELGPLLTAFIIIARSGTAIATELGGMVVSHEVEAYTSFGINPISYLVVPRFLGMIVSMVLLTIYFSFFGLIVSFAVAQFITPIPIGDYITGLSQALTLRDLLSGITKSFVFASIISLVSSHQGLLVQGSSTEIPQAGIKAVGKSFTYILVAELLLTTVFYVGL